MTVGLLVKSIFLKCLLKMCNVQVELRCVLFVILGFSKSGKESENSWNFLERFGTAAES
jgi:hypothetical protein